MSPSSCFRSLLLVPALVLAALATLALVGCAGNTDSADLPSDPALDAEESAVVYQLNQVRSMMGVPQVTDCTSLNASASSHSDDMRDNPQLPLGIPGSDGSDVRSRACKAGYTVACSGTPAMGEVVAFGYGTGDSTLAGWSTDTTAGPIIMNPSFVVVGVGRSEGANGWYWTMDLGGASDPSCAGQ